MKNKKLGDVNKKKVMRRLREKIKRDPVALAENQKKYRSKIELYGMS